MSIMDPAGETYDREWIYDADMGSIPVGGAQSGRGGAPCAGDGPGSRRVLSERRSKTHPAVHRRNRQGLSVPDSGSRRRRRRVRRCFVHAGLH